MIATPHVSTAEVEVSYPELDVLCTSSVIATMNHRGRVRIEVERTRTDNASFLDSNRRSTTVALNVALSQIAAALEPLGLRITTDSGSSLLRDAVEDINSALAYYEHDPVTCTLRRSEEVLPAQAGS